MSEFVRIPFRGNVIPCDYIDGRPFVALRPICQALEVRWEHQRRSIMADPVLSSVVAEIAATAADGKTYQMTAIPLDYLNGWLFRLDAGRYKVGDPRRERIIEYQKECYRALCDYFWGARRGISVVGPCILSSRQDAECQRVLERHARQLREWALQRDRGRLALHRLVELAFPDRRWDTTGSLAERWLLGNAARPQYLRLSR